MNGCQFAVPNILQAQSHTIHQAAQALAAGKLVGIPTETVYGLGADACNDAAIARIFATKGRPSDHPLIVHVANPGGVTHFASHVPAFAQHLIATFWPGPLTVILPRHPPIAQAAAGAQNSIGLRCPAHPVALSLLRACLKEGVMGIAAPSANRFGRISPTRAQDVQKELNESYAKLYGEPLLVLDGGDCQIGIESTIVDCTRGAPVLLRPGMLSLRDLSIAARQTVYPAHPSPKAPAHPQISAPAPKASGTLASHYAPRAKLMLVSMAQAQAEHTSPGAPSRRIYVLPSHPEQAAHELFATLRDLDQPDVTEIWVTAPPDGEAWDGVRDRLQRASA